jgi:type IX secretion system PorP/SprF family membrane protein
MRNIKFLTFILVAFITNQSWGQQETSITNYWSHMNLFNPAYVGSDNMINFKSTIRNQWSGISESPVTQMFSYSKPFGDKVGLGLSIVNDKVFVENSTYVGIDFSYKLTVSDNTLLYFGLKAAANFYSVNAQSIYTIGAGGVNTFDNSLFNIDQFDPNIGLGFLLKREKWFLSLSVPRMLSTERASTEDNGIGISTTVGTSKPHLYVSSGYKFNLKNPKWSLSPSVLLRSVKDVPVAFDSNLLVSYNDKFDLSFTYGNSKTYAITFGLDFADKYRIGYSYETSSRSLLSTEWNSSELFLAYSIPYVNKRNIKQTPVDDIIIEE